RQTGFLVPSFDVTHYGGIAVGESFFWAIDRSRDLTLTAVNYEKRGVKGMEDFRYVLSPDSKGQLQSAFLEHDRALANEYTQPIAEDRWFVHYKNYFDLPDDFVQRFDVRQVSDVRYPRDFPEELTGLGDPSLESKMSVTKNTETSHLSVESIMNTNLLK